MKSHIGIGVTYADEPPGGGSGMFNRIAFYQVNIDRPIQSGYDASLNADGGSRWEINPDILKWLQLMIRRTRLPNRPHDCLPTAGSPAELLEARQLMMEVNTLVDNVLPPLYLEISAESKQEYDKEFFQFLIPQAEIPK